MCDKLLVTPAQLTPGSLLALYIFHPSLILPHFINQFAPDESQSWCIIVAVDVQVTMQNHGNTVKRDLWWDCVRLKRIPY